VTARGLIVSAPRSSSGKTTITLGLLAALARRGVAVRAAKSGPDYIDPAFHASATGAKGINLDTWAMPPSLIDELIADTIRNADALVIEGAMGLFDGVPGTPGRSGAASDLAARLGLPVLLVLDVSGQSQSAAAVAAGFAAFNPSVRVGGVVLNRLGSERHRSLIADALAPLRIPLLGAIPRDETLVLPERHLGLVQASEHADLTQRLERLAAMAERHLDLDAIMSIATPLRGDAMAVPLSSDGPPVRATLAPPGQRIALASDAAFTFVYAHVLDGWRRAGAEVVPFSPMQDEAPPMCAGCPAATRNSTPADWRRPAASWMAFGNLPGRVRSTASAAATWCWAKASRISTVSATRWPDCSVTQRASPNAGCISAIARRHCSPITRSARSATSCGAMNSIMLPSFRTARTTNRFWTSPMRRGGP
jgi:cobyrinic acid a,c-diamide synthase